MTQRADKTGLVIDAGHNFLLSPRKLNIKGLP